jgi:hypothetical protein
MRDGALYVAEYPCRYDLLRPIPCRPICPPGRRFETSANYGVRDRRERGTGGKERRGSSRGRGRREGRRGKGRREKSEEKGEREELKWRQSLAGPAGFFWA